MTVEPALSGVLMMHREMRRALQVIVMMMPTVMLKARYVLLTMMPIIVSSWFSLRVGSSPCHKSALAAWRSRS